MITFLHKSWNYLKFIFTYRVQQGPIFMVFCIMILFYIFWVTNKNEHLFLCLSSMWIDCSNFLIFFFLIFLLNCLSADLQEFFMYCGHYICESYALQTSSSSLWLFFFFFYYDYGILRWTLALFWLFDRTCETWPWYVSCRSAAVFFISLLH